MIDREVRRSKIKLWLDSNMQLLRQQQDCSKMIAHFSDIEKYGRAKWDCNKTVIRQFIGSNKTVPTLELTSLFAKCQRAKKDCNKTVQRQQYDCSKIIAHFSNTEKCGRAN